MRVAVISDVHSNLQALQVVEAKIDQAEVDLVLCAGDIVGYGASPNECCEIVERIGDQVVLGNHDISALNGDTRLMNPYAAKASRWTSQHLSSSSKKFLESLKPGVKINVDGRRIAMYHGSPRDISEYVYENDVDRKLLDVEDADLLILGHTHVPYAIGFGDNLVLNPGSVGQPRDGDPRASYAIIDIRSRTRDVFRVDYDIDVAASEIASAGLPRLLGDRLFSGV